jgi:SHS2 domain-containing protein
MYSYFEHQADVGIMGKGKTVEEAFGEGAKALFGVMVEVEKIEPKEKIEIKVEAENLEELFVEWLNRLLAEAGINEMVFGEFEAEINQSPPPSSPSERGRIKEGAYNLTGVAWGEKLNIQKHQPKIEVKAATYAELFVGKENNEWVAKCVVDV